MKPMRLVFYSFLFLSIIFCSTCSSDSDENPGIRKDTVAIIDGEAFIANISAYTTNEGLEIKAEDGSKKLLIRLLDASHSTYSVLNLFQHTSLPSTANPAVISYQEDDSDFFFGKSGTLTLSQEGDELTIVFNFSVEDENGSTVEFTDGRFINLKVKPLYSKNCILKSYTYPDGNNSSFTYTARFEYDDEGHLIRALYVDNSNRPYWTDFFYRNNVLTHSTYVQYSGPVSNYDKWHYNNNKLESIESIYDGITVTQSFFYNSDGQCSEIVRNSEQEDFAWAFTYNDTGNIESMQFGHAPLPSSGGSIYSNYDSKKNPFSLLAKRAELDFFPPDYLPIILDFITHGKNNVGRIAFANGANKIEYEYSNDLPAEATYIDEEFNSVAYVTTFEYANCN